ncbi:MAG TPA: WbqC family protein [Clostridia bacterium]|nr:WbqC family protein [Clostridia bacterium]
MIVSIHQPNFLPWLGYFHKIMKSDLFIFLDNVQLPRGKSFCHRTAYKAGEKRGWLTVPVLNKSKLVLIKEAKIANNQPWVRKHLGTIKSFYGKTPYFEKYYPDLQDIYGRNYERLIDLNVALINYVLSQLKVNTKLLFASEILPRKNREGVDYLISLVKEVGGKIYLSGQGSGSKRYIDEKLFTAKGIRVKWQNFNHPVYRQTGTNFLPNLSIIDLLFNEGCSAQNILLEGESLNESRAVLS